MKLEQTKVRINVTQRDIDTSVCNDAYKCMVAAAINRRLKPGWGSSVGYSSFVVGPLKKEGSFNWARAIGSLRLPQEATDQIYRFDGNKKRTKPFRFTLSLPSRAVK